METIVLNPVHTLISPQENELDWKIMCKLFLDVKNMPEIHSKLMEGKIQAALLNPSLIVDSFQIAVAGNKASRSYLGNRMATKSLHTELIYNLSPTRKIAQALQTFGVIAQSKNLLLVVLTRDSEATHFDPDLIDGKGVPLHTLGQLRDRDGLKKIYKLSDNELKEENLLDSVLGRMACKELSIT